MAIQHRESKLEPHRIATILFMDTNQYIYKQYIFRIYWYFYFGNGNIGIARAICNILYVAAIYQYQYQYIHDPVIIAPAELPIIVIRELSPPKK